MAGSGAPAAVTAPDALLAGLIDDAALFPPARLPLRRALVEHAQHRRAWYGGMVGPFLCPTSAVAELQAEMDADASLQMVLIASSTAPDPVAELRTAVGRVLHDQRLDLLGVELPPTATEPADVVERLDVAVPMWLEIDRSGDWRSVVDAITELRAPVFAKLRMGGVGAAAVPSVAEVAAFLRHTVDSGLPFKLTAGLHHPILSTDPLTGIAQHGFLNVLCALHQAQHGGGSDRIAVTVATTDPAPLTEIVSSLSIPDSVAVRRQFRSFGCCAVREPIGDLIALGLVTPQRGTGDRG